MIAPRRLLSATIPTVEELIDIVPSSIPDERPLTAEERRLARWMLEHGGAEAAAFLPQLERARVVSRCPCGCASINLEVEGEPRPSGGMKLLSDWWFMNEAEQVSGIFIYQCDGVLAGIEVYGLAGDIPLVLPPPEALSPMVADGAD